MWIPDCLPPTYPACQSVHTERFGIPVGQNGRCAAVPIRGVVLHCITVPTSSYIADTCTLPRNYRTRGRRHHDSLHWIVGQNNSVTCMVSEEDVAWGWGDFADGSCLPTATWPPLASLTPDQYDCALIHVGIELPPESGAYHKCCGTCEEPTPYAFNETLIRLLAAISQKYNFPLNTNYFQLDTNLRPACAENCECIDIQTLLCGANRYCERPTVFTQEDFPNPPAGETLVYVLGITNTGRVVKVPLSSLP